MQGIENLLDQARRLGQSIAQNERVQAFFAARDAVHHDPSAQALLKDYMSHVDKLRGLEAGGKPIEVADKHRLGELEQAMAHNDPLKDLMRTQADYVELMTRVNQALEACLGGGEAAA
ncbi:hypothetical protein RAS1_01290 [Phycisphaerae bacterium RAS1]|nr:hypothetical protein RAS1_01290 [Phycisphaerae bacterium RAS1]